MAPQFESWHRLGIPSPGKHIYTTGVCKEDAKRPVSTSPAIRADITILCCVWPEYYQEYHYKRPKGNC